MRRIESVFGTTRFILKILSSSLSSNRCQQCPFLFHCIVCLSFFRGLVTIDNISLTRIGHPRQLTTESSHQRDFGCSGNLVVVGLSTSQSLRTLFLHLSRKYLANQLAFPMDIAKHSQIMNPEWLRSTKFSLQILSKEWQIDRLGQVQVCALLSG